MRFLITGATGLLGSKIIEYLRPKYKVYGTSFSREVDGLLKLDIRSYDDTIATFKKIKPDVIIHTAAIVNPDYSEENKEETYQTNVVGTKNVVEASKEFNAKIIYVSTDAVFSDSDKCYTEDDKALPINYYAQTKLEGEKIVEKSGMDYIVSRITGLYGYSKYYNKISFPQWVIENIQNGKQIKVVDGMKAQPTLVDDTSRVILELLNKNQTGMFHMTGPDYITRLEFAYKVCDTFNLDKSLIVPEKQKEIGFKAVCIEK